MSPDHQAVPIMLQDRAGLARLGITGRNEMHSVLPTGRLGEAGGHEDGQAAQAPGVLSCWRPHVAPRCRMIGITLRFDRIDDARLIAIALSGLTMTRVLPDRPIARLLRLATAAKQSHGKLRRL